MQMTCCRCLHVETAPANGDMERSMCAEGLTKVLYVPVLKFPVQLAWRTAVGVCESEGRCTALCTFVL